MYDLGVRPGRPGTQVVSRTVLPAVQDGTVGAIVRTIRREPSPMSYPQPPQYGPPSGMPQRLPSSGTYVSTAVFGIMAGVLLLMGLTETEHIERMPDELVVILLLQLLVVMGMIAGSILLFTKKFPGVFVFLGATVVYLLTLFLVPALLDVPLGAYVKVLVTETEGIGSYGVFILALSVVSLGCGFAPSTRRYLAFVDARKKQGGPGM